MKKLWKLWSVRLAAAWGTLVVLLGGYVMQDPGVVPRVVALVPEQWRPVAVVLGGFLAFALPTLARGMPQAKLHLPPEQGEGSNGPP